ncbi:MAG: L-carnitine dehydrogenase [Pseudomonadota bacterium]
MAEAIKTVAVVGTGVIGAGWAARCLANGLDVVAWDPGKDAEAKLKAAVENAWPALIRVGLKPGADLRRLKFVKTVEEAVGAADFVQESAPEVLELKIKLHKQIDAAARPDVVIGSSTSGLLPSDMQKECKHPERLVVGHPFNPVYLLPLVEVLGGKKTAPGSVDRACAFYEWLGMRPLRVKKEIEGFVADRLLEAVWRESLHLINDGVATTADIDDAMRFGPGIRFSYMGQMMIYHIAGGDAGMHHFMAQFGPALKLPWTKLEAPELTQELIDKVAGGTTAQAKGRSVKELERFRNDCIIEVMEAISRVKAKYGMQPGD